MRGHNHANVSHIDTLYDLERRVLAIVVAGLEAILGTTQSRATMSCFSISANVMP